MPLKARRCTPMNRTMPPDTSTADLVHELGLDKQIRVAIVDDDAQDRDLLIRCIKRSDLFEYDIGCFDSFADGLEAINTGNFHIAFVDYYLGDGTGHDLVRRARSRSVETPIVIITGRPQRRMDIEVLRDGGVDVVKKDDINRPSVFERIVRHTLVRARQARELERRASYDDLTGLANRSHFRMTLESRVRAALMGTNEVSVVYADLDGFKAINDRHGHLIGDAVLHDVASRLASTVCEPNLVARLGGDEFAVVVAGGEEVAKGVARDIDRVLDANLFLGGRRVQVHASVGSATHPGDGETADQLVDHADRMMYGAKQRRANGFSPVRSQDRWWRRRQRLVDDFPKALENDELHLVFQPQLDGLGGRVRSVEVLTRWDHPSLGAVPPSEFIPAIERCGLSYELDSWVIRHALEARRAWSFCTPRLPRLAINVSAHSLVKPSLLQMVNDGLTSTGQRPDDIEIELTETAVLDAQAAPVMNALRASGISLAIDDFGVGQSSLASLAQTPATVLKLDRTLLVGASVNPRHEKVLRWAIRLGRDLGMEVVAEGIEAPSQMALLAQESVDGYQGFLLARPLPADQLMKWFATAGQPAERAPHSDSVSPSIQPASDPSKPTVGGPGLPC